jgi:hypothetical protein
VHFYLLQGSGPQCDASRDEFIDAFLNPSDRGYIKQHLPPPLSELVSKLVMSYRTCVIHSSIGLQFLAFLCLPVLEDPQPRRQLKQAGYEIKLSSLVARRTPSQVATPGPIWGHVSSLVPLNLWVTWLPHRA